MRRSRHAQADRNGTGLTGGAEAVPLGGQPLSGVRESRVCSLTVVMALFTAVLVLAVAAITFAITYTTSLDTLRSVGQKYAESLATTASVKVIDIFEAPAAQIRALSSSMRQDGYYFPTEDPTTYGVMNRTMDTMLALFLSLPGVYNTLGVTWDDGSVTAIQGIGTSHIGLYNMNARSISNKTAGCCGQYIAYGYALPGMTREPFKLVNPAYDGRATSFTTLRSIFVNANDGLWFTATFIDYQLPGVFALPAVFAARNASGTFLGMVTATVGVVAMGDFLKKQTLTPNGYTFMIDLARTVTATSHPAEFISYSWTSNFDYTPNDNCASTSGLYNRYDYHNFTVACRLYASQFPYAPLRSVSDVDELMVPQEAMVFRKIEQGGETYYVASAQIPNSLQPASATFKLYLLLFVPESDLIGDVVAARTTVIVIVAAVFVFASLLAAAVIHLVLRPLKGVAMKMRSTARLKDLSDSDNEMSQLKEVYELQLAFRRMNNAIGSFTRYVPRDVVKDLMKSGQLCQIQMSDRHCSMLFVDIASFTTMCERVPAEELSRLVKTYFEQMSTIVTDHDGLIDKYIGDCIMAVWGAPFGCENQEVKATLCALLIDRETRVEPLVGQFDAAGEQLSVRVGVASGAVLAGNMGSSERMSYTVIGDSVNLAARLESLNKQFGTRAMIDEATAVKCKPVFCLRHLLKIAVVGKDTGISVYEVVGLLPDIGADAMQQLRDRRAETSGTDTASSANMSSAQSMPNDKNRSAAAMIDRAKMLQDASPIASEKAVQRAAAFSQAVEYYLSAKFSECLRMLHDVTAGRPEDKSALRLQELAEAGSRMDGVALARFDGVWRSEEK